MIWIAYIMAGLGAGIVTGLAGLSAAVVITPVLVSLCGWQSYDAVTVLGSYCGYLFSQKQPDGLGNISMLTTIFPGLKFLFKPITEGKDSSESLETGKKNSACHVFGLWNWLGMWFHRKRRRYFDADRIYNCTWI